MCVQWFKYYNIVHVPCLNCTHHLKTVIFSSLSYCLNSCLWNPRILNLDVLVVAAAVNSSSSEAERVEPVASSSVAWASARASSSNSLASTREVSHSLRLAFSRSVQVGTAESVMYPLTVGTCGLAGKAVTMVTTRINNNFCLKFSVLI